MVALTLFATESIGSLGSERDPESEPVVCQRESFCGPVRVGCPRSAESLSCMQLQGDRVSCHACSSPAGQSISAWGYSSCCSHTHREVYSKKWIHTAFSDGEPLPSLHKNRVLSGSRRTRLQGLAAWARRIEVVAPFYQVRIIQTVLCQPTSPIGKA